MPRSHALATAAVLLGFAAIPPAAEAALIIETFAFTASGFSAGAPFDPVSGRATIVYDLGVSQGATPVPSFSSTLPAASYGPFFFVYDAPARQLQFGDNCTGDPPQNSMCSASGRTTQTVLAFNVDAAGLPMPGPLFAYTTVSSGSVFGALSADVSVATGAGAPVPEPASLALLATGIVGLTFAVRRRA